MSVLQKGVITIVGATLVASALILYSGKNVAEVNNGLGSTAVPTSTSLKVMPNSVANNANKKQTAVTSKSTLSLSPPPIGPFQIASPREVIGNVVDSSLSAVLSGHIERPEFKKMKPSFPVSPKQKNPELKPPGALSMNKEAPVLLKTRPSHPQKPQYQPSLSPEKISAPINTHAKPQKPKQNSQKQFKASPPVQRYMYVPVPVFQPNLVPQIPVPPLYYAPSNIANGAINQRNQNVPKEMIKPNKNEMVK